MFEIEVSHKRKAHLNIVSLTAAHSALKRERRANMGHLHIYREWKLSCNVDKNQYFRCGSACLKRHKNYSDMWNYKLYTKAKVTDTGLLAIQVLVQQSEVA